jgi:hypothetical protein
MNDPNADLIDREIIIEGKCWTVEMTEAWSPQYVRLRHTSIEGQESLTRPAAVLRRHLQLARSNN